MKHSSKIRMVYLFIDSLARGGAERNCVNYANIISDYGCDVTIVVYKSSDNGYQEDLKKSINIVNLNARSGLSALPKIIKLAAGLKIDLAICFNPQISILVYLARFVSRSDFNIISRCVNNLSELKKTHSKRLKQSILNVLMPVIYSKMDHYIAQCESMASDLHLGLSIPENRISTIYNLVDEKFSIAGTKFEFSESPGKHLLFVGRFKPQKGIDLLTTILMRLLKRDSSYLIHLLGDGEDKPELIEELALKGFKENIIDHGVVDNVEDYYRAADTTILTSRFEGFPNVLSESICCGTPVVSFDCPTGPGEIINNHNNGYLVSCFNIDDYVDSIPRAVSLKGRDTVKLRFNNLTISSEIEKLVDRFSS